MSQWSGKIPDKTSFQIFLLTLLTKVYGKHVIDFQESSKKFVIQTLTKNLTLNFSGALFFVGIGYSLKWWYKDQFFLALLKQNLPSLSEPQQRVSWETSAQVLKEQNYKFVEKGKTFLIDKPYITPAPQALALLRQQRLAELAKQSFLRTSTESFSGLAQPEKSLSSQALVKPSAMPLALQKAEKADQSFFPDFGNFSNEVKLLKPAKDYQREPQQGLGIIRYPKATTGIEGYQRMPKTDLFLENRAFAESFFPSLLDRIDLYTNHAVIKLKSPWEKHAYQRFVGVFSQSMQPKVSPKVSFSGLALLGNEVKQTEGKTFASFSNFSNKVKLLKLAKLDNAKVCEAGNAKKLRLNKEHNAFLQGQKGDKFSRYTIGGQVLPKTWFKLSARNFYLPLTFNNNTVNKSSQLNKLWPTCLSIRFTTEQQKKTVQTPQECINSKGTALHSQFFAPSSEEIAKLGTRFEEKAQRSLPTTQAFHDRKVSNPKDDHWQKGDSSSLLGKPWQSFVSLRTEKSEYKKGKTGDESLLSGNQNKEHRVFHKLPSRNALLSMQVVHRRDKDLSQKKCASMWKNKPVSPGKLSYPLELTGLENQTQGWHSSLYGMNKLNAFSQSGWQIPLNALFLNSYLDNLPYKLESLLSSLIIQRKPSSIASTLGLSKNAFAALGETQLLSFGYPKGVSEANLAFSSITPASQTLWDWACEAGHAKQSLVERQFSSFSGEPKDNLGISEATAKACFPLALCETAGTASPGSASPKGLAQPHGSLALLRYQWFAEQAQGNAKRFEETLSLSGKEESRKMSLRKQLVEDSLSPQLSSNTMEQVEGVAQIFQKKSRVDAYPIPRRGKGVEEGLQKRQLVEAKQLIRNELQFLIDALPLTLIDKLFSDKEKNFSLKHNTLFNKLNVSKTLHNSQLLGSLASQRKTKLKAFSSFFPVPLPAPHTPYPEGVKGYAEQAKQSPGIPLRGKPSKNGFATASLSEEKTKLAELKLAGRLLDEEKLGLQGGESSDVSPNKPISDTLHFVKVDSDPLFLLNTLNFTFNKLSSLNNPPILLPVNNDSSCWVWKLPIHAPKKVKNAMGSIFLREAKKISSFYKKSNGSLNKSLILNFRKKESTEDNFVWEILQQPKPAFSGFGNFSNEVKSLKPAKGLLGKDAKSFKETLQQKKVSMANLDCINPMDKEIVIVSKKSRLMSGYVYPDMQSDFLKTILYNWLEKNRRLESLGDYKIAANIPIFPFSSVASGQPSAKVDLVNEAYRFIEKACLTSIKIPITPTTFLSHFLQPNASILSNPLPLLALAKPQQTFALLTPYPFTPYPEGVKGYGVKGYGKGEQANEKRFAVPSILEETASSGCGEDLLSFSNEIKLPKGAKELSIPHAKLRGKQSRQSFFEKNERVSKLKGICGDQENGTLLYPAKRLLLPYQKFNHHLAYFPGFPKLNEFLVTLPQISQGNDMVALRDLGLQQNNEIQAFRTIDGSAHKKAEGGFFTDIDEKTKGYSANLGLPFGAIKQGNTFFDCNRRKLAYNGIVVQRNKLTKDLQPFNQAKGTASLDFVPFDLLSKPKAQPAKELENQKTKAYPFTSFALALAPPMPQPAKYGVNEAGNKNTKDTNVLPSSLVVRRKEAKQSFAKQGFGSANATAKAGLTDETKISISKQRSTMERDSSIWGTFFLGSENPLTNRQCHFFGQKHLSTLDTTNFQRDYLRQLGKEAIAQSNLKGFTEKLPSVERAKIVSFSKRINSFVFKKRKYTYLLDKKDEWHLLFQEQLRTAFQDNRKYPALTSEETFSHNPERIKVSAPLLMARFPKETSVSLFPQLCKPLFRERAFWRPFSSLQLPSLKTRVSLEGPIQWGQGNLAENSMCLSFPYSLEGLAYQTKFGMQAKDYLCFTREQRDCWKEGTKGWDEGRTMGKIFYHYPLSTEVPSLELSPALRSPIGPKKCGKSSWFSPFPSLAVALAEPKPMQSFPWHSINKAKSVFAPSLPSLASYSQDNAKKRQNWDENPREWIANTLHYLIQEPLTNNSWAVLSQWLFLISLLFWIEQVLLENVFPALSSLEQALLGATGLKSSDRVPVVRVSKGNTPKFQDLAGVDGLLGELSELVLFLRGHKEHFWEKKNSYGVLLTGPPGTGKTFLVRALANEAGVPVLILSVGNLVANKLNSNKPSWSIRHAFRRAKQLSPCILFIDEIDALGKSRGKIATDINEVVANTALSNLDSSSTSLGNFSNEVKSLKQSKESQVTKGLFTSQYEGSQPINTINTPFPKAVSYEELWQNWPTVPQRLANKWASPLESIMLQESNGINSYSLCEEKMFDLLERNSTQGTSTNKSLISPSHMSLGSQFNGSAGTEGNALTKLSTHESHQGHNKQTFADLASHTKGYAKPGTSSVGDTSPLAVGEDEKNSKRKFGPLTQLLVSMDGVNNLSGVLIMGATNRPELLDPALIRPGRFERIIRVEKPSEQKRIEILQLYSHNLGVKQRIPWSYLANRTKGLTVADLAVAMNYSSLKAIIKKSTHTLETIEYGLDCIARSFKPKTSLSHATSPFAGESKPRLTASGDANEMLGSPKPAPLTPYFAGEAKLVKGYALVVRRKEAKQRLAVSKGMQSTEGSKPKTQLVQKIEKKAPSAQAVPSETKAYFFPSDYPFGVYRRELKIGAIRFTKPNKFFRKDLAYQRLAQIQKMQRMAYYQAGKIVTQTLLPQHPPTVLVVVNPLGITQSTSADLYIPNSGASNTQSCSLLEARLIGFYGGKAASQLFEYNYQPASFSLDYSPFAALALLGNEVKLPKLNNALPGLVSFASAGNNTFQSNIGSIEIQAATQLASQMVNKWNSYSLNLATLTSFTSRTILNQKAYSSCSPFAGLALLGNFSNFPSLLKLPKLGNLPTEVISPKSRDTGCLPLGTKRFTEQTKTPLSSLAVLWRVKQIDEKHLRTAISRSKNSLKYTKSYGNGLPLVSIKSSYSNIRVSSGDNGSLASSATNQFDQGSRAGIFQLINSLQFSNVQRDRFYPGWFRLYLPDMEATEFQKNVLNCFFSLGLQTLIRPSVIKCQTPDPISYSGLATKKIDGLSVVPSFAKERAFSNLANHVVLGVPLTVPEGLQSRRGATKAMLREGLADKTKGMQSRRESNTLQNKVLSSVVCRKPLQKQFFYVAERRTNNKFNVGVGLLRNVSKHRNQSINLIEKWQCCAESKAKVNVANLFSNQTTSSSKECQTFSNLLGLRQVSELSFAASLPLRKAGKKALRSEQSGRFGAKNIFPLPTFLAPLSNTQAFPYAKQSQHVKQQGFVKLNNKGEALGEQKGAGMPARGFNNMLSETLASHMEQELISCALVNNCFTKASFLINQNRQLIDYFVDYLIRFQILRQHQILFLFSTMLLNCKK